MPGLEISIITAKFKTKAEEPQISRFFSKLLELLLGNEDSHGPIETIAIGGLVQGLVCQSCGDRTETPGVEITIKRKSSDLMHLKSHQIDGQLLRTGAANFSASGLKRQDNDLIVIESSGAAASFKRNFEARYATGG
jgi:phosphatidylserine/phosphatidylglycerophosphate/cardiolipin synthase-like enzyme